MSTAEERMKILNMIAEKRITPEEGAQLLAALQRADQRAGPPTPPASSGGEARYLRVRVSNLNTGKERASVNIPLNLVNVAMRMGARFAPEMEDISYEDIVQAIRQGARGKVVDVTDEDSQEHVEIFVE